MSSGIIMILNKMTRTRLRSSGIVKNAGTEATPAHEGIKGSAAELEFQPKPGGFGFGCPATHSVYELRANDTESSWAFTATLACISDGYCRGVSVPHFRNPASTANRRLCIHAIGGYGPPPPGAVALSGPHPFMPLPSPPLNVTGIGEPRRSLHPNGEDLPVDMVTLRYFYNMGVDLHWRMSHHTPPDELGMFGYHQQNNTDQQAGRTVVIGATEDNLTAVESTPPPSPEVANATEQSPLEKSAYAKRNLNSVKVRGKRPEQLQDIKDSLGPAAFLPTPTPSPSSNGSQFSFYTTPSPHHHLITPPRLLQPPPPPPIFYHKAGPPQLGGAAQGQTPYAWGMPAPVVSPYEVINNYNMDPSAQPQQQQPATLQPAPLSVQSQPAAVYAATRHH
uniref:RE75231p1 n=1 Tax=Drosophila melanogaster TaxID=7227 RepID=G4LU07_DROME|nr:RE75231p1 [Drosophila melanogaster]